MEAKCAPRDGKVTSEHPLFREAAAFVFIRAHRLDTVSA
jgi:hypothetical protein